MNKISMLDEMINETPYDVPRAAFVLGNDKPGMKLQRLEKRVWVDCRNEGKVTKSPVDFNSLPPGDYRLV